MYVYVLKLFVLDLRTYIMYTFNHNTAIKHAHKTTNIT